MWTYPDNLDNDMALNKLNRPKGEHTCRLSPCSISFSCNQRKWPRVSFRIYSHDKIRNLTMDMSVGVWTDLLQCGPIHSRVDLVECRSDPIVFSLFHHFYIVKWLLDWASNLNKSVAMWTNSL